jgi:hypothetical protein
MMNLLLQIELIFLFDIVKNVFCVEPFVDRQLKDAKLDPVASTGAVTRLTTATLEIFSLFNPSFTGS